MPAGATVVGIPARLVESSGATAEAARTVFDAYAVSADLDDPVSRALLALGSRTEDLDGRLAEILRRLEGLERDEAQAAPRATAGPGVVFA